MSIRPGAAPPTPRNAIYPSLHPPYPRSNAPLSLRFRTFTVTFSCSNRGGFTMSNLHKTSVANHLMLDRPRDRRQLSLWIELFLDLQMPETPICPHHATPLDYLEHA